MDSEEEHEEVGTCYDFTRKTWRDDVTFLVEDQHLYATKAVLAMVSTVFEAMFGTNFRERNEEEVPLPGKGFEDFNQFLHCIYPKSQKKVDDENVYKVLPLADEYDVKSLINECKRFLNARLKNKGPSTQEVLLCHGLATKHKFQGLRKVCATQLSDSGLKEILATEIGINDTETLLQMHKDILKQQGETLEDVRTELVNIYMERDLSGPAPPLLSGGVRGSIIKFKPNLNSIDKEGEISSNPVTLWDIVFRATVHVTSREGEKHMALYLNSEFPGNTRLGVCKVDAKYTLKRTDRVGAKLICSINLKNRDCSDEMRKLQCTNVVKMSRFVEGGFFENGAMDIVVYLMATEPSAMVPRSASGPDVTFNP